MRTGNFKSQIIVLNLILLQVQNIHDDGDEKKVMMKVMSYISKVRTKLGLGHAI